MQLPTIIYTRDHPAMPGEEFLIRTKPPLIVCQVLHFNTVDDMDRFIVANKVTCGAKQFDGKVLTAYCGMLSSYDWKDKTADEVAQKMAAIVRRMSDWYHHNIFLKNEEKSRSAGKR